MSRERGKSPSLSSHVLNLFGSTKSNELKIKQLYNEHKCIMKNANFASAAYQKLANYFFNIKNELRILEQSYLSPELPISSLNRSGVKSCFETFIASNSKIVPISRIQRERLQENSRKLSLLHEMHLNPIKKKYEKYIQVHENFLYYQKKVGNLRKGNVMDHDHERIQRNVDKLSKAQDQYMGIAKNLHKNIIKINEEVWSSCVDSFITSSTHIAQTYNDTIKLIKDKAQDMNHSNLLSSEEFLPVEKLQISELLTKLLQNEKNKKNKVQPISISKLFSHNENLLCENDIPKTKTPPQIFAYKPQIKENTLNFKKNQSIPFSQTDISANLLDL